MRYAVISDVHANTEALERTVADAKKLGVAEFVCLGDIVGYGPSPGKTVAAIRALCSISIAGNHDDAVSGRIKTDDFIDLAREAVLRHKLELNSGDIAYLAGLPCKARFADALAVHGDAIAPEEFRYIETPDEAAENFNAVSDHIIFAGHTHEPAIFYLDENGTTRYSPPCDFSIEDAKRYIVNPGSIGYPREKGGKCLSSYAIYDTTAKTISFRFIPFAVSSVMQRSRAPVRHAAKTAAAIAVCAAVAAASALLLFTSRKDISATPRRQTPGTAERPTGGENRRNAEIARKTVVFNDSSKKKSVRPNLLVNTENSDAGVLLKIEWKDGRGKTLATYQDIVKKSIRRTIAASAAARTAASAELHIIDTGSGKKPKILVFNPVAAE